MHPLRCRSPNLTFSTIVFRILWWMRNPPSHLVLFMFTAYCFPFSLRCGTFCFFWKNVSPGRHTKTCSKSSFLRRHRELYRFLPHFLSFVLLLLVVPQCEVSEIAQCSTQEYCVCLRDLETWDPARWKLWRQPPPPLPPPSVSLMHLLSFHETH